MDATEHTRQTHSTPDNHLNGAPCRLEDLPEYPSRVLVADDEHLVAAGLASNLMDLGYEVVGPASSGDEAVSMCREDPPDIALLDICMPGRDGLSAAKELFESLGIPVVMFSAFTTPEYIEAGRRAGVFGYLLKPVTQEQLRAGISIAWGRYFDWMMQNGEIETLRQRLEDRKIVERAKWLLVQKQGLTEPQAQRALQQRARDNRTQLAEVAAAVLESERLFTDEDG